MRFLPRARPRVAAARADPEARGVADVRTERLGEPPRELKVVDALKRVPQEANAPDPKEQSGKDSPL